MDEKSMKGSEKMGIEKAVAVVELLIMSHDVHQQMDKINMDKIM